MQNTNPQYQKRPDRNAPFAAVVAVADDEVVQVIACGPDEHGPAIDVAMEQAAQLARKIATESWGATDARTEAIDAACQNNCEDAVNWFNEDMSIEGRPTTIWLVEDVQVAGTLLKAPKSLGHEPHTTGGGEG